MKRLRDFESIAAFFSDREIKELQAAMDARHAARSGRPRLRTWRPRPETERRGREPWKEEGVQAERVPT